MLKYTGQKVYYLPLLVGVLFSVLDLSVFAGELSWQLNDKWSLDLPVKGELDLGYRNGLATRPMSAGELGLSISFSAIFHYQKLLKTTVHGEYSGRENVVSGLPQRHVAGKVDFLTRPLSYMRFGFETELGGMYRPEWPDQYQPQLDGAGIPTGQLMTSDRYSFWHASGLLFMRASVFRRMHLEVYGGGFYRNYTEDQNYDGLQEPNHLIPGDKYWMRGGSKFSGRAWNKQWRYLIDLRADWIRYLKTYARDEGTGETHAGPGGLPANPLQELVRFHLKHRSSFRFVPLGKLVISVAYERNEDLFEGYYTWNQAEWGVRLQFMPYSRLQIVLGYTGRYRQYTKNGYQEGPDHPALQNHGSTRLSHSHTVKGRIAFDVWKAWLKVFLEGVWKGNWTNFPDYEPYRFPASRAYSIGWDYSNASCKAGVEFDL